MECSKVSRSIPWMADKLRLPFSYQLCSRPNPAVSSPTFSPGLALMDPGFHPHLPDPYSFSCFIASQRSASKWTTLLCSPSQFSMKLPEKALRLLLNKADTQSQTWHFRLSYNEVRVLQSLGLVSSQGILCVWFRRLMALFSPLWSV